LNDFRQRSKSGECFPLLKPARLSKINSGFGPLSDDFQPRANSATAAAEATEFLSM
jgi:hypothetical protein